MLRDAVLSSYGKSESVPCPCWTWELQILDKGSFVCQGIQDKIKMRGKHGVYVQRHHELSWLLSCASRLLRDLCSTKTPLIFLFTSKNWKVDVQVRKQTQKPETTPWSHGRESALCFYLHLHELSSEFVHTESDKSLSCPGKVGEPSPHPFCCALQLGRCELRVYELLKSSLCAAPKYCSASSPKVCKVDGL